MDTSSETPRPHRELARLPELPPAVRAARPPASQPSTGGSPLNVRTALRGLARHWWQALALWVIGTSALAAVVYLRFAPTYRSEILLQVVPNEANPFGSLGGSRNYRQTQGTLITTSNVLLAAANDPKVAALPSIRQAQDVEAELKELLKVRVEPGTNLIEVAAESPLPSEAKQIVSAVVDAFLETDAEWSAAKNSRQIEKLETYAEELDAEIAQLEGELVAMARESKTPFFLLDRVDGGRRARGDADATQTEAETDESDGRYTVGLHQYAELHQRLLDLELQQRQAEADLETVRRQASAVADPQLWIDRQVETQFQAQPDVQNLRAEYRDLTARIDEFERRYRSRSDPSYRNLIAQQQELTRRYNELWTQLEPLIRSQLETQRLDPSALIRQAEAKVARLESERGVIEQQLERLEVDQRELGTDSLKMSFLNTKLQEHRAMRSQVSLRLEQMQFDARGQGRIIQVNEARAGGKPTSDKRTKFLALTPLAMLGLVLGLVTLVEMRAGRVSDTEALSGRVAAEVFSVPPLPTARSGQRRLGKSGTEAQFEQFVQQLDHLRVALCGEGGLEGRGRCVMITSASGGEGKTTLAAQLAVRCAEAGASTVLIDADLRRATLGRLFEVPECPGLSDVLRGDASLEDALVPISQVGGCQLLPAGSPESNPNRILRGKAFGPMLERLRRSFDVVIVDTSPVLPVPDALILGRFADGAVLAARHDQSRFPAVERANHLLAGAGISVLGVVVNGARPTGAQSYHYSYRTERAPGAAGDSATTT